MSGAGIPVAKPIDCSSLRVAVVAARWHDQVINGLLAGTQRALSDFSVGEIATYRVPGAFELPLVAQEAAKSHYDAVVALGVVIRGGTPHFDYVCSAATQGLTQVALEHSTPVGFGLLTCDTEEQALDRAGLADSSEDKGYEVTAAALFAAQTLAEIRSASA